MTYTLIEKIIANHTDQTDIKPGEIVDISIDVRVARDFGGPNVVKNIIDHNLPIDDAARTFFTFDTNPTGSDQKYAANQHYCRTFARERGIKVYDINAGIGTHLVIDEGLALPGGTIVSTDSHANILGAIGAFGQGMGDRDIAAVFAYGSAWFKVPPSAKIILNGQRPAEVSAKDIVLNLLNRFGANSLLGYAVELYGPAVDDLTLDERITIASMATEMGAIALLLTPSPQIMAYCETRAGRSLPRIAADPNAHYDRIETLDLSRFTPMVSRPGHPEDAVPVADLPPVRIDSAFVGSCTNGRIEDMRAVAQVLKDRQVAPGVVLKIVPTTDEVWQQCLDEGLLKIFKDAGALVGNAGCAGCAAGQIGQNGPGEVTISTGNRNFSGKQGKGDVFLASPASVATAALSGYINHPTSSPQSSSVGHAPLKPKPITTKAKPPAASPTRLEGRVWLIDQDNIDTDMIFHNRYLAITDIAQMGQYTFDNLSGWQDFAKQAQPGDIIITGKNFGAGSSRQQAVDCFKALGVQLIMAESFGAIYERNAINAAFPILTYTDLAPLALKQGDQVRIDLDTGQMTNLATGQQLDVRPFSAVQMKIYQRGGLL